LVQCAYDRFIQHQVGMAWNTWLEVISVRRRDMYAVHAALAKLSMTMLNAAWSIWVSCSAEAIQQLNALATADSTFTHRLLRMAWNRWWDVAGKLRREAEALKRGAVRLLKRQLGMAWNRWVEVAASLRHDKEMLQRGLSRLLKRQLGMAWNRWVEVAALKVLCAEDVNAALIHMLQHAYSMAWNKWREHTCITRSQEVKIDNVILSWVMRHAARSWRAWRARMDSKKILCKAVQRMSQTALGRGWNAWVEAIMKRQGGRELVDQATLHWVIGAMLAAWNQWRVAADELYHVNEATLILMEHLALRGELRVAWGHWKTLGRATAGFSAMTKECLIHWTEWRLAQAWRTWAMMSSALGKHRKVMSRAHLQWEKGNLFNAWGYWQHWMGDHLIAFARIQQKAKRRLFRKWKRHADRIFYMKSADHWGGAHWKVSRLHHGFHLWKLVYPQTIASPTS